MQLGSKEDMSSIQQNDEPLKVSEKCLCFDDATPKKPEVTISNS